LRFVFDRRSAFIGAGRVASSGSGTPNLYIKGEDLNRDAWSSWSNWQNLIGFRYVHSWDPDDP